MRAHIQRSVVLIKFICILWLQICNKIGIIRIECKNVRRGTAWIYIICLITTASRRKFASCRYDGISQPMFPWDIPEHLFRVCSMQDKVCASQDERHTMAPQKATNCRIQSSRHWSISVNAINGWISFSWYKIIVAAEWLNFIQFLNFHILHSQRDANGPRSRRSEHTQQMFSFEKLIRRLLSVQRAIRTSVNNIPCNIAAMFSSWIDVDDSLLQLWWN